ncbi:signal transduction histidine kinase [Rathayibacter sp. PhB93]|uniref:sensor histidine kinase n=1 Tax=unclassified Rathayibacter TaxID=2609250 RepID=UPI000F494008|nr:MULTISPECIES: ATP-binding protein [unclassified Rathayibacter]ROQ15634.1 signal transduction histidine kinase [Rathayibacter sp. PhB93]TDQ15572.1 signal transduction histidine kinase [Rathayibacter sp. PhB1]
MLLTTAGLPSAEAADADALEVRREQGEVGVACARRAGGVFAGASALHLVMLVPTELPAVLPSALLLVISAAIQLSSRRAGPSGARAVIAGLVLGVVALAAFLGPGVPDGDRTVLSCVTMLASMALPAPLLAIGSSARLGWAAVLGGVPALALGMAATTGSGRALFVGLSVVVCWVVAVIGARWLASSVERAHAGTTRLRTAHAAERRSSESEAQRRREARLMHDTILATLTLLAHRGEGVPVATLRSQAAADLALLRRLDRADPAPADSAEGSPAPAEDAGSAPSVLAEVGRRAEALGVQVRWHSGTAAPDAPPLPGAALDALARAAGECLENVRRHSGATTAHVTLDEGADSVRVTVADAGRGFDPAAVPASRLGLAQSVVGRIEAVGGSVRVFSAVGAGTTVLLSVPR